MHTPVLAREQEEEAPQVQAHRQGNLSEKRRTGVIESTRTCTRHTHTHTHIIQAANYGSTCTDEYAWPKKLRQGQPLGNYSPYHTPLRVPRAVEPSPEPTLPRVEESWSPRPPLPSWHWAQSRRHAFSVSHSDTRRDPNSNRSVYWRCFHGVHGELARCSADASSHGRPGLRNSHWSSPGHQKTACGDSHALP